MFIYELSGCGFESRCKKKHFIPGRLSFREEISRLNTLLMFPIIIKIRFHYYFIIHNTTYFLEFFFYFILTFIFVLNSLLWIRESFLCQVSTFIPSNSYPLLLDKLVSSNSEWFPFPAQYHIVVLIFQAATPQNDQTHSNNSSAFADELFECVWPFYGVGA